MEPRDEPVVVDNRGMTCAQGIMRLMRALMPLPAGQLVRVVSTDPAARDDYPAWCRNTGNPFLRHEDAGGLIVTFLRKRA
ncbi:MAG: sulfurtransferase TusA family protein [Candidatus Rokubacteria bacterium]|nr:sulfurtransferase TusA family protein [Candidatus Rokubacteria bacterium]